MIKKILKEGIILILLLVAIVLILGVLFYDYIPTGKVVPVVEQYQTSQDIKNEIQETVVTENQEIIVTYEIDNTDLKTYEKSKDYDKGKENPFADYTAQVAEDPDKTNTTKPNGNNSGNSNNTNTTNNNNSNNVTNTNSSDGTFFNSTKTK